MSAKEPQFYIFANNEKTLLGVCGLAKPDWTKLSFEICCWLRTSFVGHGYMTEAVIPVTQFALKNLGPNALKPVATLQTKRGSPLPSVPAMCMRRQ